LLRGLARDDADHVDARSKRWRHRPGARIVVGVDGSPPAQEALRWAVALGDCLDLGIVAVHAVGPLDRWHDPDASARSWRRALSDLVERTWCAPLSRAATAHRVEVREGHPVDVLLTAAATQDAALVVVGSRGMGTDPAVALGSTSLQVLYAARVPVLVVPGRRRGADRRDLLVAPRLLVGVDGSQPSLAALALAADIAGLAGGSLRVLHVFGRRGGHALDRMMTPVEAELRDIRERGLGAHTIVRSGDPAPTILDVADDVDADLVVVGTRGHGGQAEMLPDSVARTVAGQAERPTLVVPAAAGRPRWRPSQPVAAGAGGRALV
jgi:nucleotide-binding universal stress UspA family protein